jgi:hypothetical protein
VNAFGFSQALFRDHEISVRPFQNLECFFKSGARAAAIFTELTGDSFSEQIETPQ